MKVWKAAVGSIALSVNWTSSAHHASKHRYSIEGSKAAMDAALQTPHPHLDIRSIQTVQVTSQPVTLKTKVRADVVGSDKDVKAFVAAGKFHSTIKIYNGKRIRGQISSVVAMKVEKHEEYDEAAVVAKDRGEVMACIKGTEGYLDELKRTIDKVVYTTSPFFECFRPSHEIFAFLDTLTEQNSQFLTKYENVSGTFEGRDIPAFKISTSTDGALSKKTLYTQALLHAREWQAGAATVYTMAAMLDDLRAGNDAACQLFDTFDWYFLPVVNVDGYQYTWEVDRMWRTNRHLVKLNGEDVGVDLNRNWPPNEFFILDSGIVDGETYPGDYPLSEPSTAGLFQFITTLDSLSGIVDMHTFGGLVLRPFSNQQGNDTEPFASRLRALGDGVSKALSTQRDVRYKSETGANLYRAYGCFDDGMFAYFNFTVPALTIEVEGEDFVSPQSTIRSVGKNIDLGLRQFAREARKYSQIADHSYSHGDFAPA